MKNIFFTLVFLMLMSCKESEVSSDLPLILVENDLTVEEGNGRKDIELTLTLSEPSEDTVLVFLQSTDGSALGGEDYEELSLEVVYFAPGDVTENYLVEILGDRVFEEDESFTVELQHLVGATASVDTVVVTLLNDDPDTALVIPETGYETPGTYAEMNLVWSDEFDGDALNEDDWSYEMGTGSNGWGNNELEYYRRENTSVVEGHLVITAKKESFGGRNYTSSRLVTRDKQEFQYGRVDIRAVLPYGQGIWPALWMLGENISTVGWPACGEIDVMEMIGGSGRENTVHGTIHYDNGGNYNYIGGAYELEEGIFNDEFHVFSIIWDENEIVWYIDDQPFYEVDLTDPNRTEFHHPFFFIFNVAVGGNWPGSPDEETAFPQRMIVDYIRVFEEE